MSFHGGDTAVIDIIMYPPNETWDNTVCKILSPELDIHDLI